MEDKGMTILKGWKKKKSNNHKRRTQFVKHIFQEGEWTEVIFR